MTHQDAYSHGSMYEIFIRRAFKCERREHGSSGELLEHLLNTDLGKNSLAQSYDKQLNQVKNYLTKAVEKFLKRKPTDTERLFLDQMIIAISSITLATDLVDILNNGLNQTSRYIDL